LKNEKKASSLLLFPALFSTNYLLQPLLPLLLGVARAGADLVLFVEVERREKKVFVFLVEVERKKKRERRERHWFFLSLAFSLSISLRFPIPSSPPHREQRELLDGRARARVPGVGHRLCKALRKRRAFFFFCFS
jgi:hypothetical protein